MSTDSKKIMTDYWICAKCAKEKKWIPPKGVVTCVEGMCFYCSGKNQEQDEDLVPILDYGIPGDQSPKAWD